MGTSVILERTVPRMADVYGIVTVLETLTPSNRFKSGSSFTETKT
jgi:hypothetical protein